MKDARIVIMNPPFTNRAKMGEKFPGNIQQALRSRVDEMERILVRNDENMEDFTDKNSHKATVCCACGSVPSEARRNSGDD